MPSPTAADETGCVFYSAATVSRTGDTVTLGVWIAPAADPMCSKLLNLQHALETAGYRDYDVWKNSDGLRLRATFFACSSRTIHQKAVNLANLIARCLDLAIGLSKLPDPAAVERALT